MPRRTVEKHKRIAREQRIEALQGIFADSKVVTKDLPTTKLKPAVVHGMSRIVALRHLIRFNNPNYILIRHSILSNSKDVRVADPLSLAVLDGRTTPIYLQDMGTWVEQIITHTSSVTRWAIVEVEELKLHSVGLTLSHVNTLNERGQLPIMKKLSNKELRKLSDNRKIQ